MQTPRGRWCGDHQRWECTSLAKRGGVCHSHHMVADTDRCRMHLGKKASAVIAEHEARKAVARLDLSPVGDPLNQLAILAAQVLAWRDAMAEQVNGLTSLRYESFSDAGSSEQLRAEVSLWERALDRCERVLTAMARLNIDERLARISERQIEVMEAAIRATLADPDFGLDIAGQDKAAQALGRRLRAV